MDAAFVLGFDRNLDLDASAAYMFATLASVSLWNVTGSQLMSCPIQENLYFSIRDVWGLMDELVVTSSNGLLPDPRTSGSNCLEDEELLIFSSQVKIKNRRYRLN